MYKFSKILAYLGFLAMIVITFFHAAIFISADYKSSYSIIIYSGVILSIIFLIFICVSDMNKKINIAIAFILSLIFLFTPGVTSYLISSYDRELFKGIIDYVLDYTFEGSTITWLMPTFF